MASYSSSLASQSPHPWRYDVFISFRGQDTRRGFSCHLYDALCRKGLLTFIDDYELQRGEEIAESLVQAIQESKGAVVVFSKDYASSTWCLDELVKIIECHQTRGQIVIPVFYDVNPSHIRKQSFDVGTAFEGHKQNPRNAHKIQNWRDALTMTTNLSGLDSNNFRNDHMLISEIVEDISKKLKKSTVCDGDEQLVGVDSHFQKIKQALSFKGQDVCIIGIWGMGGIGKTTIAEFIFKRLSSEFKGCCFLEDVRKRSVRDLKNELNSQLLGRKRALIVLDDVDDSQQLNSLIGDPCWFGSRSVIIVTGRYKQVLGRSAGFLYEVEPLQDDEALQLFSWSAFKQNNPKNDYESLSSSVVKYAQGNPLALKVLGSSLSGKTTKEWESALNKLSKVWNKHLPLRISFIYWLAIQNKLSTVDRLPYIQTDKNCPMCSLHLESCDHLFFACDFNNSVWNHITALCEWRAPGTTISEITAGLSAQQPFRLIVLGVCIYRLWQERNLRRFKTQASTKDDLISMLIGEIRENLLTMNLSHHCCPSIRATLRV